MKPTSRSISTIPAASTISSSGSRRRSIPLRSSRRSTSCSPRGRPRSTTPRCAERSTPRSTDTKSCRSSAAKEPLPTSATPAESPGYLPYCPYTADPDRQPRHHGPPLAPTSPRPARSSSGFNGLGCESRWSIPLLSGDLRCRVWKLHGRTGELGYEGSVRTLSPGAFLRPEKRVPDGIRWVPRRLPGRVQLHHADVHVRGTYSPSAASAGFCDLKIDAMIDDATQLQLDDPGQGGRRPLGWRSNARSSTRLRGRVARESDRRRVRLRTSGQLPGAPCGARYSISSGFDSGVAYDAFLP